MSVFERSILEVQRGYFVNIRLNIQTKTRTIFNPLSYFYRTLGQTTCIIEYSGFKFRFHSQKKEKERSRNESKILKRLCFVYSLYTERLLLVEDFNVKSSILPRFISETFRSNEHPLVTSVASSLLFMSCHGV